MRQAYRAMTIILLAISPILFVAGQKKLAIATVETSALPALLWAMEEYERSIDRKANDEVNHLNQTNHKNQGNE